MCLIVADDKNVFIGGKLAEKAAKEAHFRTQFNYRHTVQNKITK